MLKRMVEKQMQNDWKKKKVKKYLLYQATLELGSFPPKPRVRIPWLLQRSTAIHVPWQRLQPPWLPLARWRKWPQCGQPVAWSPQFGSWFYHRNLSRARSCDRSWELLLRPHFLSNRSMFLHVVVASWWHLGMRQLKDFTLQPFAFCAICWLGHFASLRRLDLRPNIGDTQRNVPWQCDQNHQLSTASDHADHADHAYGFNHMNEDLKIKFNSCSIIFRENNEAIEAAFGCCILGISWHFLAFLGYFGALYMLTKAEDIHYIPLLSGSLFVSVARSTCFVRGSQRSAASKAWP